MEDSVEKAKNKEVSLGLRELAFNMKIADLVNSQPLGDYGIYGTIMEMGYEQATVTVACFISGDASIYFSSGGAMLGGGKRETIKNASLNFIHSVLNFITNFQKTEAHPFPKAGQTTFYVFTKDGLYSAEALTSDFKIKEHPLRPLFAAGQEVITGYRLLDQKK